MITKKQYVNTLREIHTQLCSARAALESLAEDIEDDESLLDGDKEVEIPFDDSVLLDWSAGIEDCEGEIFDFLEEN